MQLFAFQGLRYTAAAGDGQRLAAPPYDQINDTARARFVAQSPYQFVHLTRPIAAAGGDPYRHAADLHAAWLRDGLVTRDAQPSLYPYVIELGVGGAGSPSTTSNHRRLGVMALVGYEPPSIIRPHEQTLDKPLADRTALLEATHIDLEPALLLAEDDGRLETLLAEDLGGTAASPALTAVTAYRDYEGHIHRLYRIADPQRIAAYQQALAGGPAAIADGHHRYKVGQRFAEAHGATGHTAAAAKLAVVTSMLSPELTIDPIHRALRNAIPEGVRLPLADRVPFRGSSGTELAAAVAAAAGGQQPALGVWIAGSEPWIGRFEASGGRGGGAGGQLAVELFQNAVLPALGLAPEAATDGTLVYRSNPDELYTQVAAGELGVGFWLPPMQPGEFAAAIAGGAMLPPKSTRFLPKAMSGLVWSDHDSKVS